jgi:hypothetical protein
MTDFATNAEGPWTGGLAMPDVLLLVFSGVVALSTVVYAVLTWKLVAETRKMREAQTEPKVSVFVEMNDQSFAVSAPVQ